MTGSLTSERNNQQSILLDEVLKRVPFLHSPQQHTFTKGDTLWRQNDACNDVPFILTGAAFVSASAKNDIEKCFSFVWASDMQGYLQNLFVSRWESQAVVASREATICFVNRSRFVKTLKDDVALQNLVIHSFSDYCRFISTNCIELSSLLLEERITRLLAGLGRRLGRSNTKSEMEIPLYLTRSQVASVLRTRVETVIRILALWRKRKWIRDTIDGIAVCSDLNLRIRSLIDDESTQTGHRQ